MTSMRERAEDYLAMRRALGHRLEGQGGCYWTSPAR